MFRWRVWRRGRAVCEGFSPTEAEAYTEGAKALDRMEKRTRPKALEVHGAAR